MKFNKRKKQRKSKLILSPAESLNKYKINDVSLIVIGEIHTLTSPEENKIKTWDFLNNKLKEGDIIHMELHPHFEKNKRYRIITNSINMQKFLGDKKDFTNIKGVDARRLKNFFGQFENYNLQNSFFYMNFSELEKVPFGAFLKVIDNIMIFINKQFYGKMRDHIIKLNKQYLDELYFMHKRIDEHSKFIKSKINPNTTFKEVSYYYKNFNEFKGIMEEYRAFIVKFMDLLIIMNILFFKNKNHTMLIGEYHAQNMFNMLKKYKIEGANVMTKVVMTKDEIEDFEKELLADMNMEVDEDEDSDTFFDAYNN